MKEKSAVNRQDIGIKDFYTNFAYSGLNNFPELSPIKKRQKLDYMTYKKIILKFFSIYFSELYFLNQSMYFFIGGTIKLNKGGNWIHPDNKNGLKTLRKVSHSIGLFWYNRVNRRFWHAIKLKKLTGSSSRIAAIEKEWKNSFDVDSLMTVKQLQKDGLLIVRKK